MKFRKRIASVLLSLCIAVTSMPQILAGAALTDDYTLCDIVVNGGGLVGFNPNTTEYEIIVPYVYAQNNFNNFPMPVVSAETTQEGLTAQVDSTDIENPSCVADGEKIYINVTDDVENILNTYTLTIKTAGKNLFKDGGFETESSYSYTTQLNNGTLVNEEGTKLNLPTIIELAEEDGGAGNKALHGKGGTDSNLYNASVFQGSMTSTDSDVYMEKGKTYVNGFMAKLYNYDEGDETSFDADVTSPNKNSNPRYSLERVKFAGAYYNQDNGAQVAADNAAITLTEDWGKYMALAIFDQDITVNGETTLLDKIRVGVDVGHGRNKVTEFLYDEMYLGELVISSASIASELEDTELLLPDEEQIIPYSVVMKNQYGNSVGLENTVVSYELLEAPEDGVTLDTETSSIIISENAEPGKVVVEATLTPKFTGAVQTAVKTRLTLDLLPSDDKHYLPKAKDVTTTGAVEAGQLITGNYRFWSYDSTEDGTSFRWLYSEDEESGYEPITDEDGNDVTTKDYVVAEDYVDYFIRFEVTPKDAEGRVGNPAMSEPLRQPEPPEILSAIIKGEMEVGKTLTGDYNYYDVNGDDEGVSTFRWLRGETADGEFTAIKDEEENEITTITYVVTEADMYKYLRFEVTPVNGKDGAGEPFMSKPYLCAPAEVLYALSDIEVNGGGIEGFEASKTEYDIYVPYKYSENKFNITEMPVVGATCVNEDASVDVAYPSKVADGEKIVINVKDAEGQIRLTYTLTIKTVGLNMFPDGGFETEDKAAYKNGDFGPLVWDIVEDEAAAGNKLLKANGGKERNGFYSVLMYNKTINGKTGVYISPGKTYVNGFMAKLDPERPVNNEETSFRPTVTAGKDETDGYVRKKFSGEYIYQNGSMVGEFMNLKEEEWGKYMNVFSGPETRDVRIGLGVGSDNHNYATYYLYDDMYLGELVVSDLELVDQDGKTETTMDIPSKETTIYFQARPLNQYGNAAGLDAKSAPVTWKLVKAPDTGISFGGTSVTISPDAEPGIVIVEATTKPKYVGAAQPYVKKRYKITLNPVESSYIPRAKNVTAEGIVKTDEVLTGDYTFYSYDSKEGESIYQWYASTNENGPFTAIANATGLEYKVESQHAEHYICFEVTPVDAEGRKGTPVKSNILQKPAAPVASGIKIEGDMIVDKTIKASYTYYDANGDSEKGSTFRWLRSDEKGKEYTEIKGATSKEYKITTDDIGCYLKFEVTPKSDAEPKVGKTVVSTPYLSASRPTADEVKITNLGNGIYTASYIYKHPHNYPEGETQIKWYLDGELIGTEMKVKPGSTAKGTLKLEIIAKSTEKPFEGKAVSKTLEIGKSSGGSGGGPGGGSPSFNKDFSVATPVVPDSKPTDTPVTNKHWASEAVEFVLAKNIMQNVQENDFGYNNLVTRAEFVEYIVKGLNKEKTEYTNVFGDVSATDSYASYLQTAVNMGMISVDTNFYPNRPVSREEICKILLFAIGDANCAPEDATEEFLTLKDSSQIAPWAVGYVRKAMKVGLLKGMGNNEFAPKGNTTRAQTAVIVQRIAEWGQEE